MRFSAPASRGLRKFALLSAGVSILLVLALLLGPPELSGIKTVVAEAGLLGPTLGAVGVALGVVVMVPRTFMSIASGMLFGWVTGFTCMIIGSLLGAAVGFALGRMLGREFVARQLARWSQVEPGQAAGIRVKAVRWVERSIAVADSWVERHGVFGMWLVRVVPLSHFGTLSYICGTASVRFMPYLLGTLVGAIPSSLGYTAAGSAVLGDGGVVYALVLALGMNALGLGAVMLTRRYFRTAPAQAGT